MIDIYYFKNRIYFYWRLFITQTFYKIFSKSIGNRSIIYPQNIMSFLPGLVMREKSILFPNSRVELIKSYAGEHFNPELIVGKESQIHQNCHITCAGKIMIGDNVIITSNVTITNIIHPHDINIEKPINKNKILVKDVVIHDQVYIYNNAVILPGAEIGTHSIVAANSVVNTSIPKYSIAAGNPAKVIKLYNFETHKWEKV